MNLHPSVSSEGRLSLGSGGGDPIQPLTHLPEPGHDAVPIIHLRVNAGAVNGELAVALPHHLEPGVGRQGGDHPQPLAFHTKTLEPVQQRHQDGAAGKAGQEHQHAAAGIDADR